MIKTLAVIPARGGSQRVPRKNLRMLGGVPLIMHTIECAKSVDGIEDIVVSTSDPEIASVAKAAGVLAVTRPVELRGPDVWAFAVTKDAVSQTETLTGKTYTQVVHLQPTSPFRKPELIKAALSLADEFSPNMVTSVAPVPKYHHPAMLLSDTQKGAVPWMKRWKPIPDGIEERVKWYGNYPGFYPTGSVAVLQLPWLMTCDIGQLTNISWPIGTKARFVVEEDEIANLDIDTELDFRFAEFINGLESERETSHVDLHPYEGHLDYLTGKRVAVVGNSSAMIDTDYGERIDGYDEVVRMNIAATRGYEKDVGTKMSIWVTCLPRREAWKANQLRAKGIHSVWLSNVGPSRQRNVRLRQYKTFPVYWYDYDKTQKMRDEFGQILTSGGVVLHAILTHSAPSEVFLTGFTFLREFHQKGTPIAYAARPELRYGDGRGEHKNMARELEMVRDMIRNATGTKFIVAAHTNEVLNLEGEDHVEVLK